MIICAAIKDTRTGAVFGGIRHGFIYSAMHDAELAIKNFLRVIDSTLDVKYIKYETFFVYRKGVCK